MDLFDITSKDISLLNDEDLRTMVGLLCESEYQRAGLPISDIAFGGDQNATDGGLDVVIKSRQFHRSIGFIPKKNTGYQVKKSNITPAGITQEMKPRGVLRTSIKSLIKSKGAYILISAATLTEKSLEKRRQAMRKTVLRQRDQKHLYVDFFDGSKLASWVRQHPSMVLWLRERIGRKLKGWQPFGNWSGKIGALVDPYILDEEVRLRNASDSKEKEMNSTEGLEKFRELLVSPEASLRLTGLSGVGKTRFVQALFEDIGNKPLNPRAAVYTDMSHGPLPDPVALVEQLKLHGARTILIVDNCPPELHKQLSSSCSSTGSNISLLTIEYDVKDDLPEETEVFIMEPSSDSLIQTLVEKRFPEIGNVNAKTIAEFSGGNARVAIALAGTVKKGETSSTLRDNDLFVRLFKQRNTDDESLMTAAEVCSLLYSFEGTKTETGSELEFLGTLVRVRPDILFRKIAELKRRNLVQSRGVWRAILPHAIANKLAKKALEAIPLGHVLTTFQESGTERLLKSFSRRLGYLHDSEHAVNIALEWLSLNGWLGKTNGKLNKFGVNILSNIAPLAPNAVLDFLERAADGAEYTSRANPNFNDIVSLLRLLAYEPAQFYRSTKLICRFAKAERINENNNSIRYQLGKLFQIYLSGTHATVEQRREIISELLQSTDADEVSLGIFLLENAIKTGSFTGSTYSFGARPRDYGFQPKKQQDIIEWFKSFTELCCFWAIQHTNVKIRNEIRTLLGGNFRGLWRTRLLFDLMEEVTKKIHDAGTWNEGWLGIKSVFLYDKKRYSKHELKRLEKLELLLRPTNLLDQARAIALTGRHQIFDFDDINSDAAKPSEYWENTQQKAREIGALVSKDQTILNVILPELLTTENERLLVFGLGFGDGCGDLSQAWTFVYDALESIAPEKRRFQFIIGFLKSCSVRDREFLDNTLDDLIEDKLFGPLFPYIQGNLRVDVRGVERLKKALMLGKADIEHYRSIEYAWYHESVNDNQFIELLKSLLAKQKGILIVLECLYVRLQRPKDDGFNCSPELVEFGGFVLATYTFMETLWENIDHCLAFLIKECLKESEDCATQLCLHLKAAIQSYTYRYDYGQVIVSLAATQPIIFLNVFVEISETDYVHFNLMDNYNNPFDVIPIDSIESWCRQHPERIPVLFRYFAPYTRCGQNNRLEWKPVIYQLLKIAPDLKAALLALHSWVNPWSWGDSVVNTLTEHLTLLGTLEAGESKDLQDWVKDTQKALKERINHETENEKQATSARNETFE